MGDPLFPDIAGGLYALMLFFGSIASALIVMAIVLRPRR
jgi:hypothetical protein